MDEGDTAGTLQQRAGGDPRPQDAVAFKDLFLRDPGWTEIQPGGERFRASTLPFEPHLQIVDFTDDKYTPLTPAIVNVGGDGAIPNLTRMSRIG